MAQILVIDHDPGTGSLTAFLRHQGVEAAFVTRGRQGLRLARVTHPDLVVVAWSLPDARGADVCQAIKTGPTTGDTPVILLAARHLEADAVLAFELGASDYVAGPVSHRELSLRIRAVLRRRAIQAASRFTPRRPTMELGALKIDREAHRVWVDGREVTLAPRSFRVLLALVDQAGRAQTRRVLKRAWGVRITDRAIDTAIRRVRASLGTAREQIETVRGVGYRFVREHR